MKASVRIGPTTMLLIRGERAEVRGGHSFAECSEVEHEQREYKQEEAGPQGRLNCWVRLRSAGAGTCLDLGTGASYFRCTALFFL